jgi:hypothetical protein
MLKDEWLVKYCDGDAITLLRFLDVETYELVGESVMGVLLKDGSLRVQDGQSIRKYITTNGENEGNSEQNHKPTPTCLGLKGLVVVVAVVVVVLHISADLLLFMMKYDFFTYGQCKIHSNEINKPESEVSMVSLTFLKFICSRRISCIWTYFSFLSIGISVRKILTVGPYKFYSRTGFQY